MKKSVLLISIFIVLIFSLVYVGRKAHLDTDYSHIKVRKVVDGDTVILANGEKLRYIGINTPELRRKVGVQWIYDPQPFAEDSTEFNRKLVGAKFVRLEFDVEERDRYGRLLAYVYLEDGTFVNAELIKKGYAEIMTIPPNLKYTDLFLRLQRQARENKRGLWERQKDTF